MSAQSRGRAVQSPNLPLGRAGAVIIGGRYEGLLRGALEELGLRVLLCPDNPVVDPRLAGHVDLSVLHLGGERLLVSRHVASDGFLYELEALNMEPVLCEGPCGPVYPQDAALCAAIVGEKLFHNPKISAPELKEAAKGRFTTIPVRQGYAKCALCPVTASAVISSDSGIVRRARAAGLEALQISPGHIALEGFDYGFIGGSAFSPSEDVLAFTGSLSAHPQENEILAFLGGKGKNTVFLTQKPIFDVGSILPI